MSNDNIYATPQSKIMSPEISENPLASIGDRLKASLIDCIFMLILAAPFLLQFVQKTIQHHGKPAIEDMLILNIIGFFIMLLLNGYYWQRYGQSIGKKIIGIKIIDLAGNKPPLWKIAILRHWLLSFCNIIPVVGKLLSTFDIFFIFTKNRRCIHDYLAGTVVVKAC